MPLPGTVPGHVQRPRRCLRQGRELLANRQLSDSSACLLAGLSAAPHNPCLQLGVDKVTEMFKYEDVERWARWPYAELDERRSEIASQCSSSATPRCVRWLCWTSHAKSTSAAAC